MTTLGTTLGRDTDTDLGGGAGPVASPRPLISAGLALVVRDSLLIARRPSRVFATILTPALLWGFFASGFAGMVASGGEEATSSYTLSLAAGAGLLVVTLASIFGSLGLIRDRESGFLQPVLVGPTPRGVIMTARTASGALFASVQAVTMLIAAAIFTDGVEPAQLGLATLALVLAAFGLSGTCTALAWHFRSIEGFHGIMAGVLLPAWLLSGAVFPPGSENGVLSGLMLLNPLSYAHAAVAGSLGATAAGPMPLVMTGAFAAVGLAAAVFAATGDAKR